MTTHWILVGIILVVVGGALTELTNTGTSGAPATISEIEDAMPTPEAGQPAPPANVIEEPEVTNRADCEEIRGTDYRSDDERVWFLARCVAR